MESTQWIPLDVKRPSAQVEVVLACVDIHDNVVHALWWLSLQGEWIITAIPASDAAIRKLAIGVCCQRVSRDTARQRHGRGRAVAEKN